MQKITFIEDVVEGNNYWYVYSNDIRSNVELLLVRATSQTEFSVLLSDGVEYFESVPIELETIDDDYGTKTFLNLYEFGDKQEAEIKWFEIFFKEFQNITGVEIERFIELYKHVQDNRPEIILKGM